MSVSGHQEVVMFYDAEESICGEQHFSVFKKHLEGEGKLEKLAATVTKAAYCVVGDGLSLRAVAFFQFAVDEEGVLDADFNLPLRYLVQHAGLSQDLGQGPIRKASRSQCPVPWHAVNLWEPRAADAMETLQSRIYRNRLKLLSSTACRDDEFFPPPEEPVELFDNDPSNAGEIAGLGGNGAPANGIKSANSNGGSSPVHSSRGHASLGHSSHSHNGALDLALNQAFAQRLDDVFGAQGKLTMQDMIRLHSEQLDEVKSQFREQLNAYRDEIHDLKVALRQEQGRSRRLQQLLRGDL